MKKIPLPTAVYAGIYLKTNGFHISITHDRKNIIESLFVPIGTNLVATILAWLREYNDTNNTIFVAIAVSGNGRKAILASKFWLQLDTVAFRYPNGTDDPEKTTKRTAIEIAAKFDKFHSLPARVKRGGKVEIRPLVRLTDFEAITPPSEFQQLLKLSRDFNGKKLTFISATPQGGGVALMRHALLRLFNETGVNASWYVLKDDPEIFKITKTKFHNVLQNVNADSSLHLEKNDKELFNKWSKKNAHMLGKPINSSGVIVIDDPQPSGLVPFIKKANPKAKIIYRSHIQLLADLASKPGTIQSDTWNFIEKNIAGYDLFISHPIHEFVPKSVTKERLIYMGATTDPLDGLNKNLPHDQFDHYMYVLNNLLIADQQTPLDHTRSFVTQIARFDPSKGIPDLIESYYLLCKKLSKKGTSLPQLVIAGSSSVDDPDGLPIYTILMRQIHTAKYKHLAKDIKILRLPHYDQLLNALLRKSTICLQLSHKEGFEVKVSEALMKAVPVIAYKTGGIPLQINHEVSGFLAPTGDTKAVANYMYKLLTDKHLFQKMSEAAPKNVSRDVLTVKNAIAWLWMANELTKRGSIIGNGKYIHDMISVSLKQ